MSSRQLGFSTQDLHKDKPAHSPAWVVTENTSSLQLAAEALLTVDFLERQSQIPLGMWHWKVDGGPVGGPNLCVFVQH